MRDVGGMQAGGVQTPEETLRKGGRTWELGWAARGKLTWRDGRGSGEITLGICTKYTNSQLFAHAALRLHITLGSQGTPKSPPPTPMGPRKKACFSLPKPTNCAVSPHGICASRLQRGSAGSEQARARAGRLEHARPACGEAALFSSRLGPAA